MVEVVAIGTVLVVDDNAQNRALAKATLDDEGIRVVLAATAEEGIAAFASERPDCVLLDVHMPGADGIAACARIRALPDGDQVAIVFVTAQRDVDTFDRAVRAGGDDFLTKPFRPSELIIRVQTALRLRRFAAERSELAAELKRQRDELQRLQLQKDVLTGYLVHDFKNPVSVIELQAERVLRNADADARSRDAAAKIHDETRSLMRMIMNLLDIGRADEGRLAPARALVDARELVAGVVAELEPRAAANDVSLSIEHGERDEVRIRVDRDLMRRVLANLLDNAIRYAPERTTVRVAIVRRAGVTELRVSDTGPGVPAADRAAVFERFVTSGAGPNRGLGLAFSKLAVEAHGGRISIDDAGPGTVFLIELPDH
jgi:two-component system sensor histidine kinase/response regulator